MHRLSVGLLFSGICLLAVATLPMPAATALPRGEGTMQVRQSLDCSGSGDASRVQIPLKVLFTVFEPNYT